MTGESQRWQSVFLGLFLVVNVLAVLALGVTPRNSPVDGYITLGLLIEFSVCFGGVAVYLFRHDAPYTAGSVFTWMVIGLLSLLGWTRKMNYLYGEDVYPMIDMQALSVLILVITGLSLCSLTLFILGFRAEEPPQKPA